MDFPKELVSKILAASGQKIDSIILDQWRTREDQWSLTYGWDYCDNHCETCAIHIAATLPEIISDFPIRTFQIPATADDRRNYGDQRALNCKTIDQYVAGFITCFTSGYTLESIEDELKYVAGFRLVYLRGVSDLEKATKKIKRRIITEVIAKSTDKESKRILQSYLALF